MLERVLDFAGLAADERVLRYAERSAMARQCAAVLELAPVLREPFQRTMNVVSATRLRPAVET